MINKGYFIENDIINLECCTNEDTNPMPRFEWYRVSRNNKLQTLINNKINNKNVAIDRLCNNLQLNLTRQDNDYYFKCVVTNDALINGKKDDNFFVSVECNNYYYYY